MSGVIFGVDCASYQGAPDWAKVSAVCRFAAEKVTEGAAYVNPRWAAAKPAMSAVASRGLLIPISYFFLDEEEPGAAQAQWFAQNAGDLGGWGIMIDVERAPDGNPTRAQAADAVAELRRLYPRHPIGGYPPRWYASGWDLSFLDWIWASVYVSGSGDPAALYSGVPASWWAAYGGRSPLLLQFTDSATVPGVAGPVDCSAFRGTATELALAVLPPPAAKPAPANHGDDDMYIPLATDAPPASFSVWADAAAYKETGAYASCSLTLAGDDGASVSVTLYADDGTEEPFSFALKTGQPCTVVPRKPWSAYRQVTLQRGDVKANLGAAATFRTW